MLILFVRSLLALIMQIPTLYEQLTFTRDTIVSWSLPMFQFIATQHQRLNANATTPSNVIVLDGADAADTSIAVTKGPFLVVYGEDYPLDCELSWKSRVEKTYELFRSLLESWEVFDPTRYKPFGSAAPASTSSISHNAPATGNTASLHGNNKATVNLQNTPGAGQMVLADSVSTPSTNAAVATNTSTLELVDGMSDEDLARLLESEEFSKW
jgi:hypothetical protein